MVSSENTRGDRNNGVRAKLFSGVCGVQPEFPLLCHLYISLKTVEIALR